MAYNSVYSLTHPLNDIHYYQGVLLVEVALTLLIFLVLRIVHYVKWGYDEEQGLSEDVERKPEEKKSEKK